MPLAAVPNVQKLIPYRVERHPAPIDLRLDGNEGPRPRGLVARFSETINDEGLRRYPKVETLQQQIADLHKVTTEEVLVCCGADDALDRAMRAFLCAGRELILPSPTFEMLPRYADLTGATITTVPWRQGPYPTEAVCQRIGPTTAAIAIVSPNNPTGAVATASDVIRLAEAAPDVALLLDLAYAEFADENLMRTALKYPNTIVFGTLSKAYGLAGVRVGYAIAKPAILGWLHAVGNPYAVASPSIALASERLRTADIQPYVAEIRSEREALQQQLLGCGLQAPPSQANFVFAEGSRASWLRDGLAGLGIGIRAWPKHKDLGQSVRITCPGNREEFQRLTQAIEATLQPQALLFDMDGVLANVDNSYREAIVLTVASFGLTIDRDQIAAEKAKGNANNDWLLCQRILADAGIDAAFEVVKQRFEEVYQGGLWQSETLCCQRTWLQRLAARLPLGIVTGRPRKDAERFLKAHRIDDLFDSVVCLEDAPVKPNPAPVRLALAQLEVERAWMLGDTPDDIVAARAAGVIGIGVGSDKLQRCGAARTVENIEIVEEWLR